MPQDTAFLQQTVRALMHGVRLKLVGLLCLQAYSLEELAMCVELKVSLVARHLRKLQALDLVAWQAETGTYILNIESFSSLIASWYVAREPVAVSEVVTLDGDTFAEWEREVLKRFFVGTRLTAIPAGRKNLEVIVRWFALRFETGIIYQEKEVNQIIQRYYHDYAFFKKDMVGRGLMHREHGIFWRVTP